MNFRAFFLPALAVVGFAAPCAAADPDMMSPEPASGWGWEVRGGIYAHAIDSAPEEGSVDLNLEVLFDPFSRDEWWVPRLHVGTTVNTGGDTSHGYAGFTWTFDFTERFFGELTFGGGFHNGHTDGEFAPPGENALGCSPLFRESASLGYRFNERWSVMATIEHLSNAGLCEANRGLTNAGARVGYSF